MKTIKVALLDDDSLFVHLLADFINGHKSTTVVLATQNAADLLKWLNDTDQLPDVLLLDLKMQEMNGVQVTQHLQQHFPSIKIIVISSHYQRSFLGFMLKAGVCAFLPKGVSPKSLIEIIQTVFYKGFYFMDEQVLVIREQISSRTPKPEFEPENILTDREIDVLKLISQQKTSKEIGDLLFITERTVDGRKNGMFAKTGAKNIAGLIIYSIQNGIINIQDLPIISSK